MVRNASELLITLLAGDTLPTAAARSGGAFAFVGRKADAHEKSLGA
jgi:hypothetical protein